MSRAGPVRRPATLDPGGERRVRRSGGRSGGAGEGMPNCCQALGRARAAVPTSSSSSVSSSSSSSSPAAAAAAAANMAAPRSWGGGR